MSRLSALAVRQPSPSEFSPVVSSFASSEKIDAMNHVILTFNQEIPTYCQEEVRGFAMLYVSNGLPDWALEGIRDCCNQAESLARLSGTPEWMAHSPMAPAYQEFSHWGNPYLTAPSDSDLSPPEKLLLALVVDRVEDQVRPELVEFLDYCQTRSLMARRAGVPEDEFFLPVSQWHALRRAQLGPARLSSFRTGKSYLPHHVMSSRFHIH